MFSSSNNLFQLDLPKDWNHFFEDNVYSFSNEREVEGVLQISAYYNEGDKQFEIRKELEKAKETDVNAHIINISNYESVHYGFSDLDRQMLHYHWILGDRNVWIFCSLLLNACQTDEDLDEDYETALKILNSIQINPI